MNHPLVHVQPLVVLVLSMIDWLGSTSSGNVRIVAVSALVGVYSASLRDQVLHSVSRDLLLFPVWRHWYTVLAGRRPGQKAEYRQQDGRLLNNGKQTPLWGLPTSATMTGATAGAFPLVQPKVSEYEIPLQGTHSIVRQKNHTYTGKARWRFQDKPPSASLHRWEVEHHRRVVARNVLVHLHPVRRRKLRHHWPCCYEKILC